MGIAFVISILILIISVGTVISQKRAVGEALDEFESCLNEYKHVTTHYHICENELRLLLETSGASDCKWQHDVEKKLIECEKLEKQCRKLYTTVRDKYQEAKEKLDRQRRIHNLFGGGANNIAAFLYYSSENRFNGLTREIYMITPDMRLLQKAYQMLKEKE